MVSTRSSAKKKLVEAEAEAEAEVKAVHGGMAKGATICGFSVFLLMTAISVRFPYLQEQRDRLGCDELCTGTMTSARHAFSLVGAALIGRLSDHKGRRPALLVGAAAAFTSSLLGIWNFSVFKALLTDFATAEGATEAERAGKIGVLGMSVGLAFIVGPMTGAIVAGTYNNAAAISCGLCILSAVVLSLLPKLPVPPSAATTGGAAAGGGAEGAGGAAGRPSASISTCAPASTLTTREQVQRFFQVPSASSPGGKLLLVLRLLLGVAYHMFSLSARGYAAFLSYVGLLYALAQGVICKRLFKYVGNDTTAIMLGSITTLCIGRLAAIQAANLTQVYVAFGPVAIALGVVNTGITNAVAKIAPSSELGGLFGLLESAEQVAGLIGPLLAGVLATYSRSSSDGGGSVSAEGSVEDGGDGGNGGDGGSGGNGGGADSVEVPTWFYSMVVVTACYVVAFVSVVAFYRKAIVLADPLEKKKDE